MWEVEHTLRRCRGEGTAKEDPHKTCGLENEYTLVPFTETEGTREEELLREGKCRFWVRHIERYLCKHLSRAEIRLEIRGESWAGNTDLRLVHVWTVSLT